MLEFLAAAEEGAEHGGLNPYVVGAIALAILIVLLMVLLAFGKGREHT